MNLAQNSGCKLDVITGSHPRQIELVSTYQSSRSHLVMAEDPSGWSLTESDPQVFTQLLRDLGVKGLQVVRGSLAEGLTHVQDDLYSLDAATLEVLRF
jgi:hypothetical protein